jgi:hypothetical protein
LHHPIDLIEQQLVATGHSAISNVEFMKRGRGENLSKLTGQAGKSSGNTD